MLSPEIKELLTLGRRKAPLLVGKRATVTYRNDGGASLEGWPLRHQDFPTKEDVKIGRVPTYMGGTWGEREHFLGTDGILYEHVFRGQDEWNGQEIVTTLSHRVNRMAIATMERYLSDLKVKLTNL